jgi:hypothetical protein
MPHQTTIQPTHQDFHWISGPGRDAPLADFVELTRDIAAGIHTCLQIFVASDLERAANVSADPGDECAPAVGKTDAENLLRLSIAASALLRQAAEARIGQLNNAA